MRCSIINSFTLQEETYPVFDVADSLQDNVTSIYNVLRRYMQFPPNFCIQYRSRLCITFTGLLDNHQARFRSGVPDVCASQEHPTGHPLRIQRIKSSESEPMEYHKKKYECLNVAIVSLSPIVAASWLILRASPAVSGLSEVYGSSVLQLVRGYVKIFNADVLWYSLERLERLARVFNSMSFTRS